MFLKPGALNYNKINLVAPTGFNQQTVNPFAIPFEALALAA